MAKGKIGLRKLMDALSPNRPTIQTQELPASQLNRLSRYSPSELKGMVQNIHTERTNRTFGGTPDLANLISYLRPEHEEIASVVRDYDRFKVLAPEIKQACAILVASIVSPNDLQDCEPLFSIPNVRELSKDQADDISKLLSTFFNDTFELGLKFSEWCEEALFRSGAKPVLVMPHHMLGKIISGDGRDGVQGEQPATKVNEQNGKTQVRFVGKENWNHSLDEYQRLLHMPIYTERAYEAHETEAEKQERLKQFVNNARSSWYGGHLTDEELEDRNVIGALETITAKFSTELENGDVFKISENPEVLRFGKVQKEKQKDAIAEAIDRRYKDIQANHIISLLDYADDEAAQGHPFVMELPAEAVIPICVPGAKQQRLGYFVLIDAFGQPVEASKYVESFQDPGRSANLNASYKAMFGGQPSSVNKLPSTLTTFGNPWDLQKHTLTRVFDFVLDTMLRQKLQNVGLGDVSIGKMNTISACMFYRYLEKKQTSLVFVPESMITYLCFDYRDNGTGKSKLEDISFILSLRTTLLVASIMSMMRNAINHRKMEVTVDENVQSMEQVIAAVKNAYVQKSKLTWATDPQTIATDIIGQNTTIVPKNMAGITNFEIDTTDVQSQAVRADTELLDAFNNMMVTTLDVPYAALNQLGENEFSRSVATTNMFFAKRLKVYQKVLCTSGEHFARNYVRYCQPLLEQIRAIIEKRTLTDKDPTVDQKGVATDDPKTNKILVKVIANITVSLATPNVAPDKARFAEIRDFVQTVGELVDNVYNTDLVPSMDQEATDAYTMMRAFAKSEAIREFVTKVGAVGDYTIPVMGDLVQRTHELITLHNQLRNTKTRLARAKELQAANDGTDDFGGSDSSAPSSGDSPEGDDFNYGNY